MCLNKDIKVVVVSEARDIYQRRYSDKPKQRSCLYWAAAFNEAAKRHGLDALLQAGSAQFQFCHDTGENTTHFSYMFSKKSAYFMLANGIWPEMHVWSGLPDSGEIVDLSVSYQPQQARELAGLIWTPEYRMPDYFWENAVGNKRFNYTVDPCATLLSMTALSGNMKGTL